MTVRLYFDEKMIAHDPGPRHPERPDRLRAIRRRLQSADLHDVEWHSPEPIAREWLEQVHDRSYIDRIVELDGRRAHLDADTAVSPDSVDAAMLAAGGICEAVTDVCTDEVDGAFALVRPPGHHAEPAKAMGFCLFNNIAVAAEYALRRVDSVEDVAIIDWDVHHGNGTQAAFERREDVLFTSTHQFPFYPGTGAVDETGTDRGRGFTVNIPLPGGMEDGDYEAVFRRGVVPVVSEFAPDLVLVSAGFDAHERDPLAGMNVSSAQFGRICSKLQRCADTVADGNLVLNLEGGYDLDGLAQSVERCVRVLAGGDTPPTVGECSTDGREAIRDVARAHGDRWPIGTEPS